MAKKTDIRLRRSNVLNAIPGAANLSDGELAMNTNTGALYFKKSDGTIITAADNTIFHIDSDAANSSADKKIGIGTTSPAFKLSVNSGTSDWPGHFKSTDNKAGIVISDDDTTGYFGVESSKAFMGLQAGIHVNNLNVDSSGNVGIGTSSPSERLHVTDTVFIDYPDGSGTSLKIGRNDSSNYWEVGHAGGDFRLYNTAGSGSDILFGVQNGGVDQGNKVGIGTATPDKKLTVDGDVKVGNGDAFMSQNVAGSTRSLISLGTDNILRIKGNDPEGSGNVISMINGGNVGIGTTSPEEDLHVAGDIKLTGTLFNGTRDEYSNSNLIRLNQRYTGGAVSGTSYFEQNEYQKVVTITPNGSSENYQVSGTYYVQSGGSIQEVHFVAGLRSDTLPNLTWSIYYDQSNNGTAYIEPFLWTKETTTAGFILGFKVLTGSIFGSVTADIDIIPRNADDKDNVSINTTVQSEQTTIDTGFTNQSFSLRKSVINANTGLGANPGSYRLDVAGNTRTSGSLSLVGTLQSYSGAFNIKNIAQDQNLNLQVNDGGTNTTALTVQGTTANVGIGTTSPSDKLHLNGAANAATGVIIGNNNSTRLRLYHDDNAGASLLSTDAVGTEQQLRIRSGSFLALDTGGTNERVRITADGDVGIGLTSPQGTLHLRDTTARLYVQSDDGSSAHVTFGDATDVSRGGIEYTSTDDLVFSNNNFAERMRIRYTGAVGIGTALPAKKLEVDFTGDTVGARFTRSDTTGSSTIEFANSAGVKSTIGFNAGTNEFDIKHNSAVRFAVDNNGAITFNNAFTFPTSIGSSGQVLKVPSTGSTLVWADDAGGGSATVLTDTDGDTKIQVEESADEDVIRFDTAGSQRMVILANGNVGINNTAPSAKLTVSGTTLFELPSSSNTFRIQDSQNSVERFRVTQAGDVGIGTASPVSRLHVIENVNNSSALQTEGTTADAATIRIENDNTTVGSYASLFLRADTADARIAVIKKSSTDNDADIVFMVNDASASTNNEKLRIVGESGNVGIGTSTPNNALDVVGNISLTGNVIVPTGKGLKSSGEFLNLESTRYLRYKKTGDSHNMLSIDGTNDTITFSTTGSSDVVIDNSGDTTFSNNVTVTGNLTVDGTTTTLNTATLDVEDKNITLNYSSGDSSGSADGAGITIQDAVDASTDATFNWNATNDRWEISHGLNFQDTDLLTWGGNAILQHTGSKTHIGDNTSSSVLTLTGGNVGILATSPQTGLQVAHDWVSDYGSINISSGQNALGGLGLRANDVYKGGLIYRDGTAGAYWELTAYGNEPLLFKTNNAERVRITNDGNVGINEDTPLQALHVSGKQRIQSKDTHDSSPALYITDNADDVADQTYNSIHLDYNISGSDTCTADRFHRGMFLDIDSTATGGDTGNEHRIYGVDVDIDFNGDSDLAVGGNFHVENNSSTGQVTNIHGVRGFAVVDTSGDARNVNAHGGYFQAQYQHSSTQTSAVDLYGIRSRAYLTTTAVGGGINDMTGLWAEVEVDDPGQSASVDQAYVGRFSFNNDDTTNNNVSYNDIYLVHGTYAGGAPTNSSNSFGIYMTSNVPKHYFGSNVGIGTTSPDTLLEVESVSGDGTSAPKVRITNGSTSMSDGAVIGTLEFKNADASSGPHIGHIQGIANSADERSVELAFATGNVGTTTERLRISQNGYVGIGTTSPAGNLHIKSIDNVGDALLIVEADADNNVESDNPRIELRQDNNLVSGALYLEGNAATTATNALQNGLLLDAKGSSADGGTIQFATGGVAANQSGGPTNSAVKMTILRDGNVGIGTTAPADKLHISGGNILLNNALEIRTKDTGGNIRTIMRANSSNELEYGWSANAPVKFMGGGSYTERMRIHTNGNIAINQTAAPHTLTVNGTISRVNPSGIQVVNLQTNSDAGQIAINNSGGTQRIHLDSNGSSWFMGGSVGIGDSSPSSKLHVVGAVQNASLQDYGIAAFENTNLEGLSIGYDADGNFAYLYSREVGVSSRGLNLNGSIHIASYGNNVGIGTNTPDTKLDITTTGVEGLIMNQDTTSASVSSRLFFKDSTRTNLIMNVNGLLEFRTDGTIGSTSGTRRLFISPTLVETAVPIKIEEYQIDTTETSTTATTQVAIHTFAAATFRSARYTVQVTNSTDSAYHTTELLLVHDGTTANITEFGTIFTGTAAEATFDADINSGNVRLLATPASADSMEFKVIAHSVTV